MMHLVIPACTWQESKTVTNRFPLKDFGNDDQNRVVHPLWFYILFKIRGVIWVIRINHNVLVFVTSG